MNANRSLGMGSAVLALAAALPLLVAGNCTAPAIHVAVPVENESLTHKPLAIEIELSGQADPGTVLVMLNGSDVTGHFSIDSMGNGRLLAYADALWGSAFVLEGANQLDAWVDVAGTLRGVSRRFETQGDPYADSVVSLTVGTSGGFNSGSPEVALGAPMGLGLFGGSLDSVSLGMNGEIVLEFTDNAIVDGPGVDFTVFENPFFQQGAFGLIELLFSEPGQVWVSQDGVQFVPFPCAKTVGDHPYYPGCAGVYPVLANGESDVLHPSMPTLAPPVESFIGQYESLLDPVEGSGGDSYDLADVGLGWARFVKIVAADHVVGPFGPDNAAFDLDAIAAVNSVPATDDNGNGIPDAVE